LAPAFPPLISSHVYWPTSLIKVRPVTGWTSKVKGLRKPKAQMALGLLLVLV
jgi:hypothetical protein